MNKAALKNEIEKTASESNCTPIEIISAMQTACAVRNNESMIETLAEIKWDYISL